MARRRKKQLPKYGTLSKQLRLAYGNLSLKEHADISGYSQSAISKFEVGDRDPSPEYLRSLRGAGYTLKDILELAKAHCEDYCTRYINEVLRDLE